MPELRIAVKLHPDIPSEDLKRLLDALDAFKTAATTFARVWAGIDVSRGPDVVDGYPSYLPDVSEFAADVVAMSVRKPHHPGGIDRTVSRLLGRLVADVDVEYASVRLEDQPDGASVREQGARAVHVRGQDEPTITLGWSE